MAKVINLQLLGFYIDNVAYFKYEIAVMLITIPFLVYFL